MSKQTYIHGKFAAVRQLVIPKDESKNVRGIDYSSAFTKDLVGAEVVFQSNEFYVGQVLYFRADVVAQPQNKAILNLNGEKFVLLPEDWVVAVEEDDGENKNG